MEKKTIKERAKAQLFGFDGVFDSEDFVRRIIYVATEQDRIAREEEREKAKEAFCLATCKGKLHRSTCTSLGTCNEYDEFCAIIRKQ